MSITTSNKKLIVANLTGTLLEIYDISLYGYFAPLIANNFFPFLNKQLALINTLAIFIISYIARPLGSIVFGHIGDKISRKTTLVLTITLISFATGGIGLIPSATQIGIFAPFLLILFRLIQGLSFSSEFIGSIIFLMEQAPPHKKAFTASWAICGGSMGLLLATICCFSLTHYLNSSQLSAWGWRIPFLFAFLGGLISLYLRYQIIETSLPDKKLVRLPLFDVLHTQKKSVLLLTSLSCFYMLVCYLIYMLSTNYLTSLGHIALNQALAINSMAVLLQIILIPLIASFSDKIGRKPLLLAGIVCVSLAIYPYYKLVQTGSILYITLAHLSISFFATLFTSILPITLAELMPVATRCSGVGLGYNIAGMLIGGTTPVVAMLLLQMNNGIALLSLYFIFWGMIAIAGTRKLQPC